MDSTKTLTRARRRYEAVRSSVVKRLRSKRRSAGRCPPTGPVVGLVKTSRGGTMLGLRSRLNLSRETFARLLPVSTRSLATIEQGKRPNQAVARRLTELCRIVDALSEVVAGDAVGAWMLQPNPAFGGLKPIEVIERGEADRIWQAIFLLRSGVPS